MAGLVLLRVDAARADESAVGGLRRDARLRGARAVGPAGGRARQRHPALLAVRRRGRTQRRPHAAVRRARERVAHRSPARAPRRAACSRPATRSISSPTRSSRSVRVEKARWSRRVRVTASSWFPPPAACRSKRSERLDDLAKRGAQGDVRIVAAGRAGLREPRSAPCELCAHCCRHRSSQSAVAAGRQASARETQGARRERRRRRGSRTSAARAAMAMTTSSRISVASAFDGWLPACGPRTSSALMLDPLTGRTGMAAMQRAAAMEAAQVYLQLASGESTLRAHLSRTAASRLSQPWRYLQAVGGGRRHRAATGNSIHQRRAGAADSPRACADSRAGPRSKTPRRGVSRARPATASSSMRRRAARMNGSSISATCAKARACGSTARTCWPPPGACRSACAWDALQARGNVARDRRHQSAGESHPRSRRAQGAVEDHARRQPGQREVPPFDASGWDSRAVGPARAGEAGAARRDRQPKVDRSRNMQRFMTVKMPASRALRAAASSMTPSCSHNAGTSRRMQSSTIAGDVLRAAEYIDDVDRACALDRGFEVRPALLAEDFLRPWDSPERCGSRTSAAPCATLWLGLPGRIGQAEDGDGADAPQEGIDFRFSRGSRTWKSSCCASVPPRTTWEGGDETCQQSGQYNGCMDGLCRDCVSRATRRIPPRPSAEPKPRVRLRRPRNPAGPDVPVPDRRHRAA